MYKRGYVLGQEISSLNFNETVEYLFSVSEEKKRNYVCICNTHSLVTSKENKSFKRVLNNSLLNTADGMPLVWALRLFKKQKIERVDGPNLMLALCKQSANSSKGIYLIGGSESSLRELKENLEQRFIGLKVVGTYSPPFTKNIEELDEEIVEEINKKKPSFVFISLGCPKQEFWMELNSNKINSMLIGVGAAFDFINGRIERAPLFFQKIGLEWFFRLVQDPKRLLKRYLKYNTLFILYSIYYFITDIKKNKKKVIQ